MSGKVKIPARYRWGKRLRKFWNGLFDTAQAVEADDWSDVAALHGLEGSVVFSQCPICSALVRSENRNHHYSWHTGGSVSLRRKPQESAGNPLVAPEEKPRED
jgi:hypothetical protein